LLEIILSRKKYWLHKEAAPAPEESGTLRLKSRGVREGGLGSPLATESKEIKKYLHRKNPGIYLSPTKKF
jgi:hypothetical protein